MNRISIIINNYNYGRYLGRCLDSILGQDAPSTEVIVVDDGSTDDSAKVLEAYKDKAVIIFKENGGQASAMNAGFNRATGAWIWFVDADDWLSEGSIRRVRQELSEQYTRVQGWLETIDTSGRSLSLMPKALKKREELLPLDSLRAGQLPPFPPTSGNVFSRRFIEGIFPIPQDTFRICADEYLVYSGIAVQKVLHLPFVVGYRGAHEANAHLKNTLFYTDPGSALTRLGTIKRTRKLILSQFPEYGDSPDEYPYTLNHLKAMAIIQRVLPTHAEELPLDRKCLKARFGLKIREMSSPASRFKERLSYCILIYFPLPLVRLAGFLESRLKSIYFKKPVQGVSDGTSC